MAAGGVVRRNFDTASFILRALDARTRRMRVQSMVLTAPILATVFSILALSVAAGPVLVLTKADGLFGLDDFLLSRETGTVHREYVGFCAVAAFASMAAGLAYTSRVDRFDARAVSTSLVVTSTAWAAAGVIGASRVLSASSYGGMWILVLGAVLFTALVAGGGSPSRVLGREGGNRGPSAPPLPPGVSYALLAAGLVGLVGVLVYPEKVGGSWVSLLTPAALLAAGSSLVAGLVFRSPKPSFISNRRDAADLAVALCAILCAGASVARTAGLP